MAYCNLLLQFDTVKSILKLMSKPVLAEQAGRMAIENCIIVLVLSLAAVSVLSFYVSRIKYEWQRFRSPLVPLEHC